jgi:hypothetical protein
MNYHSTFDTVNIDARTLRKLRKRLNASERALFAANLATGDACLENIPPALGAKLLGVSVGYVHTMRRATNQERLAVVCGAATISALHNRHRHQPPDDAAVERTVTKLGPDRVMRALERLTAPKAVALQAAE